MAEDQQNDVMDGLEERLQSHSKAFESLLALTPARDYYGSQIEDGLDPNDQWNRKKQSKEQKRAAKKAKLDPANQKSALDVMKEREKKRKRELGMDDEEGEEGETGDETESANKRQKKEEVDPEVRRKQIAEKRKAKRQQKKAKLDAKVEKAKAKRDAKLKQQNGVENGQADGGAEDDEDEDDDDDEDAVENDTAELAKVDFAGLAGSDDDEEEVEVEEDEDDEEERVDETAEASSTPTSPNVGSPAFDVATNVSEASSSSSVDPAPVVQKPAPKQKLSTSPTDTTSTTKTKPQLEVKTKAPKQIALPAFDPSSATADITSGTSSPKIQLPNVDQAELQERLRKRIEELRAKRKADGADGKPAKSRQELLDQRRQKEEQRKAHKKEQRQKAKEEEARKREEQLRGSGSPAADIFSGRKSPRPRSPAENSFAFSKLAFEDGTSADAGLSTLQDAIKKKGPQDPKTALLAAQKKEARLAGLDPAKKADIAEKDMWLNAKKRAHGERQRDDVSLLKKTLKRKEKAKGKSEQEWNDRKEAVVKGKELKQKKRETNLAKRREEKGSKPGKKKGGKPSGGGGKKKARAGFEGRFKA
ncbi:Putative ribosomal RNA-processing protein [Septoria linicola]|uniref:Ribosomal RNA-processing protein n=1 Tax=Septoria linicola TaxID=215465 RepID=A0A9Q9B349_9PEZI|nr:putative ribosomal RNA-processing protein [Septoria linicola]USW56668.1 Putative ribosomal RNA-processing protein [Septoria linicola]